MGETTERVNPIRFTDNDTGETYTLDFNRESIKFAEDRKFLPEDAVNFPGSKLSEFFFYAMRMHHRRLSREKTDKLYFDVLHGFTEKMIERLVLLYDQARMSNNFQDEEELEKNVRVTVEMD